MSAYTSWYCIVSFALAVNNITYTIGVDLQFDRIVDTVKSDSM
jgi:hypothetical protein